MATYFERYAAMAHSYEGEIVQSDQVGETIYVHYAPIGVSVGICPWNFPLFVFARKVAPALLAGCSAVVTGDGATIGEALCSSPVPGIISMTGSVATGQAIMRNAAQHMTKVSLELGGKAPCIVMDDCRLDEVVDAIVSSRVIYSGQVCNY